MTKNWYEETVSIGRRRRIVLTRILAAAISAAGLASNVGCSSRGCERTPRRTPDLAAARYQVEKYLRALEARDYAAVVRLAPTNYDPRADALTRIEKYGGASAAQARIELSTDLAPDHASVRIFTIGADGQRLAWVENLFWEGGAWWLVLGGRPSTIPASETRRPGAL